MRPVTVLTVLILSVFSAMPAFAALPSRDDIETCLMDGKGDAIQACTALIATQKYAQAQLSEIYARRGVAYAKARLFEAALADFDKAIQDIAAAIAMKPDYADAFAVRGDIYRQTAQYDLALADENQAVALNPKDARILMNRGNIYVAMGQYERGLQDEDKAIAMGPATAGLLNGRCFSLAPWNRRLDQALADCQGALTFAPNNPLVLDSLGLVYYRKGDLAQAATYYAAALVGNLKLASALYMHGIIRLNQHDAGGKDEVAAAMAIDAATAAHYAQLGIAAPAE